MCGKEVIGHHLAVKHERCRLNEIVPRENSGVLCGRNIHPVVDTRLTRVPRIAYRWVLLERLESIDSSAVVGLRIRGVIAPAGDLDPVGAIRECVVIPRADGDALDADGVDPARLVVELVIQLVQPARRHIDQGRGIHLDPVDSRLQRPLE